MTKSKVDDRWILLLIVVLTAVSLALGIAALSTNHWHTTDGVHSHVRRGLFAICSAESRAGNYDEICERYKVVSFCDHRSTTIRSRIGGAAAMGILAVIFDLLTIAVAFVMWCVSPITPKVLLVTTTLSVISMGICITVVVHTWDQWYFCGKEFCEFSQQYLGHGGSSASLVCLSSVGYSFTLAILSTFFIILTMLCSSLFVRWDRLDEVERRPKKGKKDGEDEGLAPQAGEQGQVAPKAGDTRRPEDVNRTVVAPTYAAEDEALPMRHDEFIMSASDTINAQGSDWAYQSTYGMWWSEQEQLYLEPNTRRFYDPKSRMWYNPESLTWTSE